MGKKKKNTSSSKSTLNSDEFDLVYAQTNSAVSMDTEKPLAGGPTDKKCTHLQKSLRMSSLRSCIKTVKLSKELQSCSACSIVNSKAKVKLNNQSTTEPATGTTETGQTNNNGGDATNTQVTSNSTEAIANPSSYWMCLTCAKIGCGRLSDKQHALAHFKEKTSHSTVINTTTFDLW